MELTETIEAINKHLINHFGIDSISGIPIWRIVWSEDQIEKRLGTYEDYTSGGLYIRTVTEVREVPKYRQWIQEKYVLERLVVVPEYNENELPSARVSYEPIWVFENKQGGYLPPKFEAAKFVIDTIYSVQYGSHSLVKYVDPENTQEKHLEEKRKRVDAIIEELFGEQSSLQGTTVTGESIIVPRNYEKTN
jgi:hypothetical protein